MMRVERATADLNEGFDEIAVDHDGIEDAIDVGDRRTERHHAGMHPALDTIGGQLGDAEKLDAIAQFFGEADVDGGDMTDALDVDGGQIEGAAEGDAGEDGELMGGIDALDV